MSFGFSVGDFVLLTQLCNTTVQNARKACGAHDNLTREVSSMHVVLQRLEAEVSKPDSILTRTDDSRRTELSTLAGDCERVLRVLSQILDKYNALSQEKRSATKLWQRIKFGNGEMLDLEKIRSELATYTSALTLFLNLLSIGSQGKVEKYMDSHGGELREIKSSLHYITASIQASSHEEKSILTTYSQDDKLIWKAFRRELIKEGFSSQVLYKHKKTIKQYVMELGERGALDEVLPDVAEPSRETTATSTSTKQDQNVLIMASPSKDEYDDGVASIEAETKVSANPISKFQEDGESSTAQSPAPESVVEVSRIDQESGLVASALAAEHQGDPITSRWKHASQPIATESQGSTSDDSGDDGDDETTKETERPDPPISVSNVFPQVFNEGPQQLSIGVIKDTNFQSQNLNTPVAEDGPSITTGSSISWNEYKHAFVEDVPDEEFFEGAHPNCETQSEKEPPDDIGEVDLRLVLWSLLSVKPVGEQNDRAPYLPKPTSNIPRSNEGGSRAVQDQQSIIPRRRSSYYLDESGDENNLTESIGYASSVFTFEGSSSDEERSNDGDFSSHNNLLGKLKEYFRQRRSRRERYWKAGNAHIPIGESILSSLGPDFDGSNVSRSGWSTYLNDFHDDGPVSALHNSSSNFQPDALPGVLASAPFVSRMTRSDSSKHWRPVLCFIENDFFWLGFDDMDDPRGIGKMLGPNEPKDAHLYKPVMVRYDNSASGSTDLNKNACPPVLAAYMPPEQSVEPGNCFPIWASSSDNDEPRRPRYKSQRQRDNQSEAHMSYLSDWEDNSDESFDVGLPKTTKPARDSGSERDGRNSRSRNRSSAYPPTCAPGARYPANHSSSHKAHLVRPIFTTEADAASELRQERMDEEIAARL